MQKGVTYTLENTGYINTFHSFAENVDKILDLYILAAACSVFCYFGILSSSTVTFRINGLLLVCDEQPVVSPFGRTGTEDLLSFLDAPERLCQGSDQLPSVQAAVGRCLLLNKLTWMLPKIRE